MSGPAGCALALSGAALWVWQAVRAVRAAIMAAAVSMGRIDVRASPPRFSKIAREYRQGPCRDNAGVQSG
ncbi:hypothetical protein GCM10011367_01590 [Marinicauda pacifica]|nr:hypothetical protein GCM10011367_01590 [Marinicauda pacifica]